MLTNGTLASMSPLERQLYLLLVLAADRDGVSFYGDQRIRRTLGCTLQHLVAARAALVARDVLAHDGTTYQLLSLPASPSRPTAASRDPQASRPAPASGKPLAGDPEPNRSTPARPQAMPEAIRETLRDIFGPGTF